MMFRCVICKTKEDPCYVCERSKDAYFTGLSHFTKGINPISKFQYKYLKDSYMEGYLHGIHAKRISPGPKLSA